MYSDSENIFINLDLTHQPVKSDKTVGDIPTSRQSLVFKRSRFWQFWCDQFLQKSDTGGMFIYVITS